jgi:putative flippase GtrA
MAKKKHDITHWPVPAFLFIGLGLGLLLVNEFPIAIPAFTLIGLGVGFLVTYLTSKKK